MVVLQLPNKEDIWTTCYLSTSSLTSGPYIHAFAMVYMFKWLHISILNLCLYEGQHIYMHLPWFTWLHISILNLRLYEGQHTPVSYSNSLDQFVN